MDAWTRMFQEEADTLAFLLGEEFGMTAQQTLERLYGRMPFAVQCKLYNQQPLSEAEQARYSGVLTAIAEVEERQVQELKATFAKYCVIDPTK